MLDFVTLTPMRSVTQMRAVIDGFAARCAARRTAEGASAKPLLDAFKEMQTAARAGDYEQFIRIDRQLHLTIVDLAAVDGLRDVWLTCARYQESFRIESLRACWPNLDVLFEAHRRLVDAICEGDLRAAEEAAQSHLDAIWYRLAESQGDKSLPDNPLDRACAYIAFHLHEPLRLTFLAEYVSRVSPGHLARRFREERNMSYTEYVCELRMQKAARMLSDSAQSIGKIAADVGYKDAARFANHFRRHFEITPREYRKRFSRYPRG
ncbi:MAG: helix-turn-helix domain-containing protein [Pirellulaceae bacterium]